MGWILETRSGAWAEIAGSDATGNETRVMAGLKIRRNDRVQVIAGKDRGKQGRVLRVMQDENRLLVEHVMMVKKTVKPNPQRNVKGGIAEQENPIQISNVMLVCGNCGPVRVGFKFEGDTKVRVCRKCGQTLESKK
ncbi:MAG: 50S ribosomal protein L24 [Acidobacteriaceae bacterium]